MFNNNSNKKTDAVLAHMEAKYGEPFEYVGPWGASYAQDGVVAMLLSCNSLSENVLAEVETSEDGTYLIRDNYLAIKYSDTMESTVKSLADSFFGQSVVTESPLMYGLSPDLPATASFIEYYTDPKTFLAISVVVPAQAFDENKLQSFTDEYAALGVRASMRFVVVEDALFPSVEQESIDNIISSKNYHYFAVISIKNGAVEINARKGE